MNKRKADSDRLPPHSFESEQALLGCILLDPREALPAVRANIGPADDFFYDLRNAMIFTACCELEDARIPIDTVTLFEKLTTKGEIERVGGAHYLGALPDAASSAANVTTYFDIVEEKATLRRLIRVCASTIQTVYENDGTSCEDIVSAAEMAILKVRRQRAKKDAAMDQLAPEAETAIDRLHASKGAIGGISTGLVDLDRVTDGLHDGEMIVIAGYPGAGKSTLAMNIAEFQAVECETDVGVFSLEMTAKRLVMRLIAARARVNLRHVRDGVMTEKDLAGIREAASHLEVCGLHICDQSDMTISKLRARARQMVQEHRVGLFVVDYIQLLTAPGRKDQNREQEVATISRGLKMMAAEFNVPVIALSQLNDDGKLRESRAIGQDADTVWTLKLKDGADQSKLGTPVTIEIRKQRDGQAPATVDLLFFKGFTKFENAAPNTDATGRLNL